MTRLAPVLAVALAACGAPSRTQPIPKAVEVRGQVAAPRSLGAGLETERAPLPPIPADGLGPSILRPRTPAEDAVVATVGDIEIRASHVFARLLESNRRMATDYVDVLVIDAVVASMAEQHRIEVDAAEVDAVVEREEQVMRDRVRIDWGGRKSFEDYVAEQFRVGVDDYRRFLRVELARARYRSLVIRFLGLLEERVEVRICVNRDKSVIEEAARAVRDGADFATLAFRHSEDETRSDGGRMPPFGRDFEHPIAKQAFRLGEGEVSAPFELEDSKLWCIVYCLRRLEGRPDATFADVRDELAESLEARPLTPFEQKAFAIRWCGGAER